MELNNKQIEFLNKFAKDKWVLNEETGLVDIDGNFYCNDKKLKDFKGILFGEVKGNFYCHNNSLTSLVGSPQKVVGAFICRNNKLKSLVGSPQEVGGNFNCSYNKLTSLDGAPKKIGGSFNCSYNKITSLEGAPRYITQCLIFEYNPISVKTLNLVWKTMQKSKVDYVGALLILNKKIPNGYWSKMVRGYEDKITQEAIKIYSIVSRYSL